ncbi:peroxynitrite isomerase THAP4-like [Tenebrio molitor]|jgi:hypothetical protein|uniref:peroxynitrite isomerase THAP4-like n=1 Tax=Tenebrio molitor TaxID=7067 RepID=UPI001C399FA9|nr:unnamed protein product [Tenebrio molitor]
MEVAQITSHHEALKPIAWLIGRWKSLKAEGSYPTIKPFEYCEEILFESLGQPLINYTSRTWHLGTSNPMHLESGFLRIKPGTNDVALMVAHNFGLTTLEEGTVCKNEIKCKSTSMSRMSFAKEPAVVSIERLFALTEDGNLEITVWMETNKVPLTQHLKALYQKCE